MPPRVETVERFESRALAIHSVRCRHDNREFGPEEVALADEIVLVRGGAWEVCVAGETHVLDPNRAVLFRRGDAYRVRHPVRGGDRCTVLTLRASVARPAHRAVLVDPQVFLLHHALVESLRSDPDPCAVEETSLVLAALLERRASRRGLSRRAPARARTARVHAEIADRVRSILCAHFRERLSLSDVAESVLWSPYHLARVFRRVAGMPVHRYLTRLRLRFALERMTESRSAIALVAAEAGFSSHAHLTTAFQSEFGLSPAALRRGIDAKRLREMSKILEA